MFYPFHLFFLIFIFCSIFFNILRCTLDQKISDATRKDTQLGVWPSEVSVLDYLIQCCEGRGGALVLARCNWDESNFKVLFNPCQLFSQLVITIWKEICQYCPKQDCSFNSRRHMLQTLNNLLSTANYS